jgi:hypothetical protein
MIFTISASQVARIAGVHHHARLNLSFLLFKIQIIPAVFSSVREIVKMTTVTITHSAWHIVNTP